MEWLTLHVLATEQGMTEDQEGHVTFEIHYTEAGKHHFMREKSRFEKHHDRWFYVEGLEHEES